MFTLVEALNFRCLRYLSQPLGPFHVLVGPNASGKTTFLDVVAFLGQLVSDGPDEAIVNRSSTFRDLLWGRSGDRLELAVEAEIPTTIRDRLPARRYERIRYEVGLGFDDESGEVHLVAEKVLLTQQPKDVPKQRVLFPEAAIPPPTILTRRAGRGTKTIINKVHNGNDNYYSEISGEAGKGWVPSFKLGPRKSALGNMPADETKFPATSWLKDLLEQGLQKIVLNSLAIRRASPPGQGRSFKPDGSNLPWVVDDLYRRDPERFRAWIAHLQTALPDLEDIRTVEREDDKHRYLQLAYRGGLTVPSWVVSDGTLRLLALTLPAYLRDVSGVFLIEEPENGIHPKAVETMFQSLSSVYGAQVLLATHSPVIVSLAEVATVLCFARTVEGATDIVRGDAHPALRDWRGETNLGALFAGGVLG